MPTQVELETLLTRFAADVSDLKSKLRTVEQDLQNAARVAEQSSNRIESSISAIGGRALGTVAAIAGLTGSIDVLFKSVKLASEREDTTNSFNALIGNAEEATKALAGIKQFALETPFKSSELLDASKMLLAFGTEAKDLVSTMKTLGEVSTATGRPLQDLAMVYGTLRQQGRAFTIDIRQFALRGIPIYRELAKVFGLVGKEAKTVSSEVVSQLDKMIESGQVDFPKVEQAFKNLTGPGGQFFGQLETKAKGLSGLFSNMMEEIEGSMTEIGQLIIDSLNLKQVIKEVGIVSQAFKEWMITLDSDTKRAIMIVIAVTTGILGLAAAFYVLSTAVSFATGGLNIVTASLALGIVGVSAWIYRLGSFGEAWRIVKRAATDFWSFIKPALPAIGLLLLTVTGPVGILAAAIGLLAYYWDDVQEAVEDFYRFVRPTLREVWNLTKLVGTAIRDGLVDGWRFVVRATIEAGKAIEQVWSNMTGGGQIDWSRVKEGLRDVVLFFQYSFTRMSDISQLVWNMIKYVTLTTLDEILKNMFLVPVAIIAGFIAMSKTIKDVFSNMLVSLAKGVDVAVKAIWEAIKTGKIGDIEAQVKKIFSDMVIDGVKAVDDLKNEIQKRVGKITLNEIEHEGMKIPIGVNVEGLQKERMQAFEAVREGMKQAEKGFQEFKGARLLQNQIEDALELTSGVIEQVIFPLLGGRFMQDSAKAGAQAGEVFGQEFNKKFEKVEAVLFNSAEAITRIDEFKSGLPSMTSINQMRQNVVVQTQAPPPNTAELETVEILKKIHETLEREERFPGFDNLLPSNLGGVAT